MSLRGRYNVRLVRSVLVIVVLVLATHGDAWAQAIAGSQLSGVVKDSSGGAIPGAEVTATKTDTGQIRTVFTGGDGTYCVPTGDRFGGVLLALAPVILAAWTWRAKR